MFSHALIHPAESFVLEKESIDAIFRTVAEHIPHAQNGTINIAFISDEEMQKLNREYRKRDTTTDVLSFHYFDDFTLLDSDEVAGEILLSEAKVLSQSADHHHSSQKESYILILHGILHILGYDHETDEEYSEMWGYEEILRKYIP